jgi:hypothetical protein
MDMHVRLDMDEDGPVVVKTATPAAVDRLRSEIERLRHAAHPGVVAVVDVVQAVDPPACELRTRYAGEPVGGWAGTLASVAGLGAAVATTLADLHGVGIVHGRLDPSHILVGGDGRPRLCGFSSPGGTAPADDVAALAQVMSDLLDRARPPQGGTPLRRWRSVGQAGDQERALRLALQRALDPVPTRRPNARVLADAIVAAVPGAELPPATPEVSAQPDTLERIWAVSDNGTEAERWARAVGSGPPDLPLAEVSTADWGGGPCPNEHPPAGDSGLTIERPQLAARGGLGARPRPAPDPPSAPQSGRRRLVAAVVGIASVVALTGAAATLVSRDDSPKRAAGVASPWPPGCPRVAAPAADIDGDGCPNQLTVDGAMVTAGDARWTLGEPGDQVTLGDWDCDGSASAALLRPPTGDVFVFPEWAQSGAPVSVTPVQRVAEAVGIHTEPGRAPCDTLVVDIASGPPRTIEVPE